VVTGPTPMNVESLGPGASTTFTWELESTRVGVMVINGVAMARTEDGQTASVAARCGIGGPGTPRSASTRAEPVCPASGGTQVEIVPCKVELVEVSPPLKRAVLSGDSKPPGGHDYPSGGT